jgi:hypothetical protein
MRQDRAAVGSLWREGRIPLVEEILQAELAKKKFSKPAERTPRKG